MRQTLLERLKQDLVGPVSELEELPSRPSDVYLTGVLWPRQTQISRGLPLIVANPIKYCKYNGLPRQQTQNRQI